MQFAMVVKSKCYPDPAFNFIADPFRIQEGKPMRIRILIIICHHLKLNFYTNNILYVGNTVGHKTEYLRKYKILFERLKITFICKFL